jgi:hypothetical protein
LEALLTKLREVLKYEVSIETLIEVAMWLAIPYLLIGLTWAFFHVEAVAQLQDQLQKILPAGAEVAAYVAAALLWPVLVLLPSLCTV